MKYVYEIVPVVEPEIGFTIDRGWQSTSFWDLFSMLPMMSHRREGFFKTREEAQRAIDHLRSERTNEP